MVNDAGVNPVCCGEKMKELIPGTADAAKEKHIPSVQMKGQQIEAIIGEVIHPMTEVHYIQWIALETAKGVQFHYLKPNQEPKAEFTLNDEKPIAVYEYCNLHGLWKKDL
jgi:superoxide reductase